MRQTRGYGVNITPGLHLKIAVGLLTLNITNNKQQFAISVYLI